MHLLELFCGTKSISREFEGLGWTSTSLDMDPKTNPDICTNILQVTRELLSEYPRPDAIWASPLCTHYSRARTTAKTPRDLEGSDKLVAKVLEIASYFDCPYFIENPHSGLLKTRDVVQGITMRTLDYCQYACGAFPGRYRKRTAIWTNTDWTPSRSLCKPATCHFCSNGRTHDHQAQRVTGSGVERTLQTRNQLYSIPAALPREIAIWLVSAQSDFQAP